MVEQYIFSGKFSATTGGGWFHYWWRMVPLSELDIPIIWAGYSHYLGWIFLLPVPPTGCSLSPLQIGWLRGILNHFEPRLFPYSCPDCSPTGCYLAGYSHYLGWFLSKSGLVFVKICAGFCQNLGWFVKIWAGFCQNLGWFFSKSGLVFLKIWAGFSQNLGWFLSKSGLVFLKIWAG